MPVEPQGDVGVLGGVAGRRLQGDVLEALLRLAGPGHRLEADRLVAEPQLGELVHAVVVQAGLQHIGDQHGVFDRRDLDRRSGDSTAMSYLAFWPTFSTRRVFQQRLQPRDRRRPAGSGPDRPALSSARPSLGAVAERDVAGLARRDGQRDAAQVRRWPTTGASVSVSKATTPACARLGDPGVQRRQVADAGIGRGVDRRRRRGSSAGLGRRGARRRRRRRAPRRPGAPGCGTPSSPGTRPAPPASGSRDRQLVHRLRAAGVSQSSRTSSRDRRIWSAKSIRVWRRLSCLISPARASSVSRSPYSLISAEAVLMPMPGAPGTLSTLSPHRAWTSTTLSGGDAELLDHLRRGRCAMFFIGSSIDTRSPTSCIRSLSEETITTSPPASRTWQA